MPELRDCGQPLDELESLVRAAQDYVRASDDLRPRVLEAARSQRRELRAVGYLRHAAVVVLVLGLFAAALRQRAEVVGVRQTSVLAAVASGAALSPVESETDNSDLNWGMVDSFTELRRRQAELLRPAADAGGPRRKQG